MPSRFRAAIESGEAQAVVAMLAPDITFRSPVVYKPYEGRDAVAAVLRAVAQVFRDFRYTAELATGEREVLIFEATVGDREVQGVDILRIGPDGLVTELTVMVRPMSGLVALAEAMRKQLAAPSAA
jgi:hypothetical protein